VKKLIVAAGIVLAALIIGWLIFVNYTEAYEVGIARNAFTGELWLQEGGGLHFTAPWTRVARIDTRPVRVCVTSAGRGFNCKLVQFEAKHYREFVAVEGFRYYWWANRLSFNSGYDEEYRGMKDILRGHAYGVTRYPFIIVLRDYEPQ
jgi:hypothetical protein